MRVLDFTGLAPVDVEYRVALRLLVQDPPLDRAILEQLVGGPQRYTELRPLLEGLTDNVLTKALHRLTAEGVIKGGAENPDAKGAYALTPLGKAVVFRMHEMIPHHLSIQAYQRGLGITNPPT